MFLIILMEGIGGFMGLFYGSFFMVMSMVLEGQFILDCQLFLKVLDEGIVVVQVIGEVKVGDKILMDSLILVCDVFCFVLGCDLFFVVCLQVMQNVVDIGCDLICVLQVCIGCVSWLGECFIGVFDVGVCFCVLIFGSLVKLLQVGLFY